MAKQVNTGNCAGLVSGGSSLCTNGTTQCKHRILFIESLERPELGNILKLVLVRSPQPFWLPFRQDVSLKGFPLLILVSEI